MTRCGHDLVGQMRCRRFQVFGEEFSLGVPANIQLFSRDVIGRIHSKALPLENQIVHEIQLAHYRIGPFLVRLQTESHVKTHDVGHKSSPLKLVCGQVLGAVEPDRACAEKPVVLELRLLSLVGEFRKIHRETVVRIRKRRRQRFITHQSPLIHTQR
jgi:hypothetical protein